MKLSEKIKKARIEAGLTQQQLSDKINVSRKTLSGWENNRSSPSIESINDLSNYLKKDVSYFLDSKGKAYKINKVLLILNIINIVLIVINVVSIFLEIHFNWLTFINLIILLLVKTEDKSKNKITKKESILFTIVFIAIVALCTNQSINMFHEFYWGSFIGSILRSIVVTDCLYHAIKFIKSYIHHKQ